MSFMIKDSSVLIKYKRSLEQILKKLNIKFHSMPIYDEKYIKLKEKNGVVDTNFLDDGVPKEDVHCICIKIDSVMKKEKNNYPQVY